jgi:hypothetical protein
MFWKPNIVLSLLRTTGDLDITVQFQFDNLRLLPLCAHELRNDLHRSYRLNINIIMYIYRDTIESMWFSNSIL